MSPADLKWLEILKASSWQTTALAIGLSVFWALVRTDVIPTPDNPLWETIPALGAVICWALSLASIAKSLTEAIGIDFWPIKRRERNVAKNYIPYMTPKEKEIIAYLLYHNHKTFVYYMDGGFAGSLISRGIIRQGLRPGQVFELAEVPFFVPEHI